MPTPSDVAALRDAVYALVMALEPPTPGQRLHVIDLALSVRSQRLSDTTAHTAADAVAAAAYTLATGGDRQQLLLHVRRLAWAVPQLENELAGWARPALERLRAVLAAQGATS